VTLPTTAFGLVVMLALVLPGAVYSSVRTAVAGHRPVDREISSRLLIAVTAGTLLDSVYLLVLGPSLKTLTEHSASGMPQHPRLLGLGVLVGCVLIPATVAFLVHGRPHWGRVGLPVLRHVPLPVRGTAFEPTPTAWDKIAPTKGGKWVRIRIGEGKWVGGWFGTNSFVSTYPEPPDIFIEDAHHVDEEGAIGAAVASSAGLWLKLREGDIVEWLNP
jgi:hypothetical protein